MTTTTSNRPADALRSIPPTTMGVIALCISFHAAQTLLGWNLQLFTMCPRLILFTSEYYRIFTSVFFHGSLMHIGVNMLSTSAISGALEKRLGTIRLLFSIWWSIVWTAVIYLLVAYVSFATLGYEGWMYQHAVGFSGIIFHLSVLESYLQPGPRSIFGIFSVQSYVYPWVLLVVLQLIMPNLSFLGHLSGILTGTLEYYGAFDGLFVSDDFMVELESMQMVRPLSMLESFVATSRGGGQRLRSENSLLSLSHSMLRITRIVVKFFYNVLETILLCTCGKGCRIGSRNTSMRFWERQSARNDMECRAIRPPEFYESDVEVDDDTDYDELEPLASRLV